MKSELDFNPETAFFVIELYADAHERYLDCKAELEELESFLDSDIYPTMTYPDYDMGVIRVKGIDVEQYVIQREELRERITSLMERLKEKSDLFEVAMSDLTDREKDVINILYFGSGNYESLGLSLSYYNQLKKTALEKLYRYLTEKRNDKIMQLEIKRKEELKRRIKSYKQSVKAV